MLKIKRNFKLLIIYSIVFWIFIMPVDAKRTVCNDSLLMNGMEGVVDFGMDTTYHWWAVTQAYSNQYRMIIDGYPSERFMRFSELTFSPDGNRWAYFAEDNAQWNLVTESEIYPLQGTGVGEILFSQNSRSLIYTFFRAEQEVIMFKGKQINVFNRVGRLWTTWGGERLAYMAKRGNMFVMNIDGKETDAYDQIKPIGYWKNGEFMYAANNGGVWEVFRGDEVVSETYDNITEVGINLAGDVAAVLAVMFSGRHISIMFSDDFYEPIISSQFLLTRNLRIHPYLSMISYNAENDFGELVILNSSEYYGGMNGTGAPEFTYNGDEVFYVGCDIDCFANIGGVKYKILMQLDLNKQYAVKPNDRSIAYNTSSSLILQDLENENFYISRIFDVISPARYNWRENTYEALGLMFGRMFLIRCSF